MTIRPINIPADIPSITKIWQSCFTDDLRYIESFISHCLPYTKSWVLLRNEEPVAILSLVPSYIPLPDNYSLLDNKHNSMPSNSSIVYSSDRLNTKQADNGPTNLYGAYIYGVATLPEYRGNSYSSLLVERAIEDSIANNLDYIIVKPAEEPLFRLYRKMGIETTLYSHKITIPLSSDSITNDKHNLAKDNIVADSVFNPLSWEDLYVLRERIGSFLWPKEILEYALHEALSRPEAIAASDGELYFIAALSYSTPDSVDILETNANSSIQVDKILSYLHNRIPHAQTASITHSGNSEKHNSALLKILNPEKSIEKYLSEQYLSLPME